MKNSKIFKLIPTALIAIAILACLMVSFTGCTPNTPPAQNPVVEKKVTVNFLNHDGSILGISQVKAGNVPEYNGVEPQKPSTKEKEFTFEGWEYNGIVYKTLPAINKDTVFVASFKESVRKYTVTFSINGEKTNVEVEYGQIPVYNGNTQVYIDGAIYEIRGWNNAFAPVTKDVVYTAELVLIQEKVEGTANITFVVDGTSITEKVDIGSKPVFYGEPYRKETAECKYKFVGWSDGRNTYATASLPLAAQDTIYTAVFESVYKSFNVKFNVNGETVWETKVVYGQIPVYNGADVIKASDEKYNYTLSGWSLYDVNYTHDLPAVYQDLVFEAMFAKSLRHYVLTVNYYVNNALSTSYVQSFSYGDNYVLASPEISGYLPNAPYVSGTVTKDCTVRVDYNEFDTWSGEVSSAFVGNGTEQSPYLINSAEDLAKLAQDVKAGNNFAGKYFVMNKSIDLANIAWTAIGSYSMPFAGHFDGNGYAIHNLSYSSTIANSNENSGHGLFSTVSGTVKNLSVHGNVTSVAKYTGMVVGNLVGGEVSGCNAYGTVKGFGNVGGVVGLNSGNVQDCTNYATVSDNGSSDSYRFGGVVGTATGSASISGCINNGTVKVSAGSGYVGGVLGYKEGSSTVTNCANYGYVSNTKTYTGGVIGYSTGESSSFTNLYNYSPVSGAKHTAGIVGYNTKTPIKNSENYGYIKGTTYVAGVVAYTQGNVDNCLNIGNVTGTTTYVAGVIAQTTASVNNCINKADVYTKSSTAGGVIGNITANTTLSQVNSVKNCVNYGNITVESNTSNANLGGVIGTITKATLDSGEYVKPIAESCTNYGTITSNANYTGGVIGGCNGGVVKNCDNYGSVFASRGTYVGGIAGSNWGYGAVSGCTNYGAIFGGSYVSEICGQLTDTSTAVGNVANGKLP